MALVTTMLSSIGGSGGGSGSFTSLTVTGLTASRAVVTDGSKTLASSATTATELGYLSGVTTPTGSGALVLATSPTLVTPLLGTPTSGTLTNCTGLPSGAGITCTATNNNASAGQLGEFVSSVVAAASAVSLSNDTDANVTSISLTAGDWDVWGNVFWINSGTNATVGYAWISSTSATLPNVSLINGIVANLTNIGVSAPQLRFSLASTTTIYLSTRVAFGSGTSTACGGIYARRVR